MLWTEFHADSVTFKTVTPVSDSGGSYTHQPSVGTPLMCKVDSKTVNRVTDMGTVLSATTYSLYFAAEPTDVSVGARAVGPQCRADDMFMWGAKTLAATGPAMSMSALGEVQFKVECLERF